MPVATVVMMIWRGPVNRVTHYWELMGCPTVVLRVYEHIHARSAHLSPRRMRHSEQTHSGSTIWPRRDVLDPEAARWIEG